MLTLGITVTMLLSGDDPKIGQITQTLERMVQAVEQGNADELSHWISETYSDRFGHDHETIVDRVMREAAAFDALAIELDDLDIELVRDGMAAVVSFRPLVDGDLSKRRGSRSYALERGQRMTLRLRLEGGYWALTRGAISYSIMDRL